jgi:hypothetical protein
MRYIDILTLNEDFQPVYDIENERRNGWKAFIPHRRFLDILNIILNSLESKNPKERKSVWMQGTYGTGKSHATAVIEHLLWDDTKETEDFIENLNNPQIKERILNFRKGNRVFPVILKGASGITDNRTFTLVVERAVKDAIKKQGICISTKSDFEKWIQHIRENPLNIDWEKNIYEYQELSMYVRDTDTLLEKLEKQDLKILSLLDKMSAEKGAFFSSIKVTDWLLEVLEELQNSKIASHIILYWDEFTNVLEIEQSPVLLTELQSIAELSTNKNIFLFVVSHRKPLQTQLAERDLDKILGRFYGIDYPMEELTTYHIISGAIKKRDSARWEGIKRNLLDNERFNKLISRLTIGESSAIKEAIRNVFPIHPYTAYLATFLARNVGSTERSIFNFLYDEEQGFSKFIKENPGNNLDDAQYFLTADYLWDFFLKEFESSEITRFGTMINRYKLYKGVIEKESPKHLAVFKGILLLNILTQVVKTREEGIECVLPTEDNIKSMFLGTMLDREIEDILRFIDENGYISKMPNGQFVVSITSLPREEVEKEIEEIRRRGIDIAKWIKGESISNIFTNGILREVECKIYDAELREYEFRGRFRNDFKKPYTLHIAIILPKEEKDKIQVERILDVLSDEFKDIIFVLVEEPLGEKNLINLIEYNAEADVAKRHQLEEEERNYRNYVERLIEDWIRRIRNSFVTYRLTDLKERTTVSNFSNRVNEKLSGKIFEYGLENIEELRKNAIIWKQQKSAKIVEDFLFSNTLSDIIEKTQKNPNRLLRHILMVGGEYIVDEYLKFKEESNINHLLIKIYREVEDTIKGYIGRNFNLGRALKFLNEPPYGLYSNMISGAVLALVMKPFSGKLYETGTGKRIEGALMRDKIINLFDFWQDGKDKGLEVRLGTIEERELVEVLNNIFDLQESNINNVKWAIRDWINSCGYPLWSINIIYPNLKKAIDDILWFAKATDKELTQEETRRILNIVKENQIDIKVSLKKEVIKKGFIEWLKHLLKTDLSDIDISDIESYLRRYMQEEIALWEEEKVKDKIELWRATTETKRKEREFIEIIEETFGLNSDKTLKGIKLELRRWINNYGCPLWMFNFVNNGDLKMAFDELSRIIESNYDISERDIDNLSPVLKEKMTHIQSILNSKTGEDIFKEWFAGKSTIQTLNPSKVYNYVKDNYNKEIFLWEEEKVSQLLLEAEIFEDLKDLFVISFASNLNELRSRIEEKVNALGYPIWSLKVVERLHDLIDLIERFRNGITSDYKEFLLRLRGLPQDSMKIFQSMLNRHKLEDNYKLWIKTVQTEIPDKELDNVIGYLYRELGDKVWYWNEDKAKERVKNWYIEWKKRIPRERIEYIQGKIDSSSKDFKTILRQIVRDHPEVCDWIEKYL